MDEKYSVVENDLRLCFKRQNWKDVSFFRNKIYEIELTLSLIHSQWTTNKKTNYIISRYPDFYFGLEKCYQNAHQWSFPEYMKFRVSLVTQEKLPRELNRYIASFLIPRQYLGYLQY